VTTDQGYINQILTGAFYVGLLDGLLGVAGMMKLLVMDWIIPENSLRLSFFFTSKNFR